MNGFSSALIAFVLICGPARAAAHLTGELDLTSCRSLGSDARAKLDSDWEPWVEFVQLCPILSPQGRNILSVMTVRFDLFEAKYGWDGEFLGKTLPKTRLVDERGLTIGTCYSTVPGGFPGEDKMTFSDWRGGFPYRVNVLHIDAAALGTYRDPPLIWNPHKRRYEQRR
jgi:hypothetical protein